MKNILFVLLIVLTGSIKAQVPIKSDGAQPSHAGRQSNQVLSSEMQGKPNQGGALLPMKMSDGRARTAKTAALPIKPGGGNVASAKAAAVIPLRTADNAAKKL